MKEQITKDKEASSYKVREQLKHHMYGGREVFQALDVLVKGEGPWGRYAQELDDLLNRLGKSLLHVAVLGQFKRGKSTLINAFLGANVLPSALLPLTSVPTLIKYGREPGLTIRFIDGRTQKTETEQLFEYVTEKGNPANEKGVERAELDHDTPLLSQGIVIIDTPGIGSTFTYNTDVTLKFLPHCDVGLFIISPDPPLTEVEVEFLNVVSQRITHLFFILNKTDYLKTEEREEMLSFLEKTLCEKTCHKGSCEIFPVSALRGLEGRRAGSEEAWEQSGMKRLEDHITGFFVEEKEEVLCRALAMKTEAILEEARAALMLKIKTLETPLEDLTKKIEDLSALEAEVREERLWIRDSLGAEQQRLAQEIWQRTEALEREGMRRVSEGIYDVMRQMKKNERYKGISTALRFYLDTEIPSFFRGKKDEFIQEACKHCEDRLSLLLKRADELLLKVRKETMALFDVEAVPPLLEPFTLKWPEFYWDHIRYSSGLFDVVKKLLYRALPTHILRRTLKREALEEAEHLILRNAGKLRYSVLDGLDRVIKKLNRKLISELERAFYDTRKAIQDSLIMHQEKNDSITPLISAFKEQMVALESISGKEVIG